MITIIFCWIKTFRESQLLYTLPYKIWLPNYYFNLSLLSVIKEAQPEYLFPPILFPVFWL